MPTHTQKCDHIALLYPGAGRGWPYCMYSSLNLDSTTWCSGPALDIILSSFSIWPMLLRIVVYPCIRIAGRRQRCLLNTPYKQSDSSTSELLGPRFRFSHTLLFICIICKLWLIILLLYHHHPQHVPNRCKVSLHASRQCCTVNPDASTGILLIAVLCTCCDVLRYDCAADRWASECGAVWIGDATVLCILGQRYVPRCLHIPDCA